MRKYLIAGLLTVAFVTPALAEDFYVAVDLASGRCVMMSGAALTSTGQVNWGLARTSCDSASLLN